MGKILFIIKKITKWRRCKSLVLRQMNLTYTEYVLISEVPLPHEHKENNYYWATDHTYTRPKIHFISYYKPS